MKIYKSLQIRDVILKCGQDYKEWYSTGDRIRYYITPDDRILELKMYEDYIKDEIELLIEPLDITFDEFETMYRKARKHKL